MRKNTKYSNLLSLNILNTVLLLFLAVIQLFTKSIINTYLLIFYLVINSVVLNLTFRNHLINIKEKELLTFKEQLTNIIDSMNTQMNVTINRWINLGDKRGQ